MTTTTIADLVHDDATKPPARMPKSDSARNKRYYEAHREKRLAYMQAYYQKNIERCRETARARQAKWREELRRYKRSLLEAGATPESGVSTPLSEWVSDGTVGDA